MGIVVGLLEMRRLNCTSRVDRLVEKVLLLYFDKDPCGNLYFIVLKC